MIYSCSICILYVSGDEIFDEFKCESMEDYMQIINDFEVKKRFDETEIAGKVTVKIPLALVNYVEKNGKNMKELIQRSSYNETDETVKISFDKMRINWAVFRSFFDTSIKKTSAHVAEVLAHEDIQGCNTILMVGGFAGCVLLQKAIKEKFPGMNVVVPLDPELAVIKGAVIFGHDTSIIVQRRLRYTYGTDIVHEKEDSCTHPPTKVEMIAGTPHCMDIFSVHVRIGDAVRLDEELAEETYLPLNPLATETEVPIYTSTKENPMLVTDESCTLVGKLKIAITPIFLSMLLGDRGEAGFSVTFMFGGTEVKAKGIDKTTGNAVEVSLDCLENAEASATSQT